MTTSPEPRTLMDYNSYERSGAPSAASELAHQTDKLAVKSAMRSAQVEEKDPEEDSDAEMGNDYSDESSDGSSDDSADEPNPSRVIAEAHEAITEPPTEEQLQEIKALIDGAPKIEATVDNKSDYIPQVELGLEGNTVTFSYNKRELKQSDEKSVEGEEGDPAKAPGQFESDTFIKYIFVRDRNETIVGAKLLKQSDEPVAVFEVGDEWYQITPYAITNNGFVAAGEQLELEDDDENAHPFDVDKDGYMQRGDKIPEEVDEYFRDKEPEELDATHRFQAINRGDKIEVQMDVPTIQLWVRDGDGSLIGCRQYEEPEFGEEDEPPKKKRKISSDGDSKADESLYESYAKAEFKIEGDVTKVRVFGYSIEDEDMVVIGAEIDL